MSQELTIVNNINALQVFSEPDKLDVLIDEIEKEVKAETYDISTEEGRKRIGSVARKIGESKKHLERQALKLTQGWRDQTKTVNGEKNRMIERLDGLRDEVKKPLDEFKAKEEARINGHEEQLQILDGYLEEVLLDPVGLTAKDYLQAFNNSKEHYESLEWEEFAQRAHDIQERNRSQLQGLYDKKIAEDEQAFELAYLQAQEDNRAFDENVQRIKDEAAEEAREKEAENTKKEKERADALEQQKKDAEEKRVFEHNFALDRLKNIGTMEGDQTSIAIGSRITELKTFFGRDWQEFEQEANTIFDTCVTDLNEKFNAKEKAEQKAAADKVEADRKAAVQAEKDRQAEEQAEADRKAKKREENKKHCAKINNEALDAVVAVMQESDEGHPKSSGESIAKAIVEAIAKGEIPNVSIKY